MTLLAAVIILEPERPLPAWIGRAAQAWLLRRVREVDPALANWLHSGTHTRRPYTVSLHRRENLPFLRVTSLNNDLSAVLVDRILNAPDLAVTLAGVVCAVKAVCLEAQDHAWAGSTNYEALAREAFSESAPYRRDYDFDFATPTAFHSGALSVPLPLPALFYGSLIQAWNVHSPVPLPVPLADFVASQVAVARHQIATRVIPAGSQSDKVGETHIGFVGRTRFVLIDAANQRMESSSVDLLSRFAFYSGVGIRSTVGMGQVRMDIHA